MIINLLNEKKINTATECSPEERHILQKLFVWTDMVGSVEQFQSIRKKALIDGWNNSGPVKESSILSQVINDLELRIRKKLKKPMQKRRK